MQLVNGTTVVVRTGAETTLVVEGDVVGRVRGTTVELGSTTLTLRPTGQRHALVASTGTPALRFDAAGRKATTLTTSSGRFRLARQVSPPLLHRRVLTRGVTSEPVLTVDRGPLGVRLRVQDVDGIAPSEVAALVIGALAEVLDLKQAVLPAA